MKVVLPVCAIGTIPIQLIADFPVFDMVVLRNIRVLHPGRRFLGRARAIIHGDNRCRTSCLYNAHKGVKRIVGIGIPLAWFSCIRLPVIDVRGRTTRVTHDFDARFMEQIGQLCVKQIAVPHRVIDTQSQARKRTEGLAEIDSHLRVCRTARSVYWSQTS